MISIHSIIAILNMSKTTEISVVIPVKNEAGNIDSLVSEIHKSLKISIYLSATNSPTGIEDVSPGESIPNKFISPLI